MTRVNSREMGREKLEATSRNCLEEIFFLSRGVEK